MAGMQRMFVSLQMEGLPGIYLREAMLMILTVVMAGSGMTQAMSRAEH